MFIYTETGILIDRINYKDLAHRYGKPIEISENGLILIFQKHSESTEIHLIQVHIHKLEWVATIDVRKRLAKYMDCNGEKHSETDLDDMKLFYKNHLHELTKMQQIDMSFCLNDDGEILVRLKPKKMDVKITAFTRALA